MRNLKRYAEARERLRKLIEPVEEYISVAEQEICELRLSVKTLEDLRPHWAKGYSSDSMAAQASTAALSDIWTAIGASNQTECMDKIASLLEKSQ